MRSLAVAVVLLAPAVAWAQQHPCDPFSDTRAIAIPAALQLKRTCGNGRLDTYATECTETVSGGCGYKDSRTVSCTKTQEVCDGKAFGSQSCAALGYAGGTLRCASTCDRLELESCSVCLASGACSERTVDAQDFDDVTLIAQGNTVRAFWYDDAHFYVADVDTKAKLGKATVLADMGSLRLVPMKVGSNALTIVGGMDAPQLSVVPATGTPKLISMPGHIGTFFLPLLPVAGKPQALAILGEAYDAKIVVVDQSGKSLPLAPLYAQNAYRRSALIALAPGKHEVSWANYAADIDAKRGDLLWAMYDYHTYAFVVRGGAVMQYPGEARELKGTDTGIVAIDGKTVAAFGTEDVIEGKKLTRSPPTPTTKPLAPIAYNQQLAIARTSTHEFQAARVPQDDTGAGKNTLAIAVTPLKP